MQYVHGGGPMSLLAWANTTWDAHGTLASLFRSGQIFSNYFNEQYDRLLDEAAATVDPKARRALFGKTLQILVDDAPVIPLYQQVDIYGVAKRVTFHALSSEQLVGVRICLADQQC
jgi:peptide/nickel transport system substrate-binding protein